MPTLSKCPLCGGIIVKNQCIGCGFEIPGYDRLNTVMGIFSGTGGDPRALAALFGVEGGHSSKGMKCPECGCAVVSGKCVACGTAVPADTDENIERPAKVDLRKHNKKGISLRKPAAKTRKCPLCGEKTDNAKCPSCGYIIPDDDELDYLTHVMNAEPNDYPAAEAVRNVIDAGEKPSGGDMFADAYDEPSKPVIPKVVPVRGSKLPAAPNNAGRMPKTVGVIYQRQQASPPPPPQSQPQSQPRKYSDFYDMINDILGKFVLWTGESLLSKEGGLAILFLILAMPKAAIAVVAAVFLIFSFGKRKSPAVAAAIAAALVLIKYYFGFY